MLRHHSSQVRGTASHKTNDDASGQTAQLESLHAAYVAVAGNSGRVISGKVIQEALLKNPKPVIEQVDLSSRTQSGLSVNSASNQPSANANIPSNDVIQKSNPTSYAGMPTVTTSLAGPEKSGCDSERQVKLPKFLLAPSGESTLAPAPHTKKRLNKNKDANPSASRNTTSDLSYLFSGLKLANRKSIDELSNTTLDNPPIESNKSISRSSAPFFDTSSKAAENQVSDFDEQGSFLDYLQEQPLMGQKEVGNVSVENDPDWEEVYQRYESAWLRLFERPRMLLGILGLGIVSCSVYIALGYWWFGNSPTSQAAEPVNMLEVQESGKPAGDATSTFNNIRSIQKDSHWNKPRNPGHKPSTKNQGGILLAQAAPEPALGSTGKPATPDPTEPIKSEPVGRPDPFSPLLSTGGDSNTGPKLEEVKKKDFLQNLQYTGFIGDINSRDKVALIRVNDAVTGTAKTQIKKVGESFMVDGEMVKLRGISKRAVLLSSQGETRQLPIQQYQAVKANSQASPGGNGDPNAPGAGMGPSASPNNSGFRGAPGSSGPGGPAGNSGGPNSAGGNSARVYLNEPSS